MSGRQQRPTGGDPITAFDELGRAVFVPRSLWAEEVLPESLKAAWDDPDRLSMHIRVALDDGFAELLLPAAERLATTDPQPIRGGATLALVQLSNGLFDDAAATLRGCLDAD